jgi:hypothetical protein
MVAIVSRAISAVNVNFNEKVELYITLLGIKSDVVKKRKPDANYQTSGGLGVSRSCNLFGNPSRWSDIFARNRQRPFRRIC